ncbi:MAG: Mn2+/Fe2+ NRAMP family transporter [Planctomycetota bacterium]|jgi:Mn2+/Fe2+ NRAMP family transporter
MSDGIVAPPRTLLAVVRRLGPGLIVAGSIVGSGELIATTKVGAESGFVLLWLILVGCVIKVFTQVELGRSAVVRGVTALQVLDDLPGPRLRAGWAVWLWVAMTLLTLAQQGGIIGGVGQALAMTQPLTDAGAQFHELQEELVSLQVQHALNPLAAQVAETTARMQVLRSQLAVVGPVHDEAIWATVLAVPTSVILVVGRFAMIQMLATIFVVAFTLVTMLTVVMLQLDPVWAIRSADVVHGLSFQLPPSSATSSGNGASSIATALAAFGIIGVGAAELVMYPYWCIEKGYARMTGAADGSSAWRERARGWMRVLQCDAWLSAVVYTFATVAFFLLGAAVLGRIGLNPEKENLVRTLAQMYAPVFGSWATPVFLVGAFAVLYSTFFVASAGLARIAADCVIVLRLAPDTAAARLRYTRVFCGALPLVSLLVFLWVRAPAQLVLAGGIAQALMLPVLGFAALWSRYRRTDAGLTPGKLWDALLWLSCVGFLIAGVWAVVSHLG